MNNLPRRLVAEALGTFTLVFFGCGAVIMNAFPAAQYNTFGIALAHALALGVAVTMTMNISGAHLNPAVTAGLWLIGKRIGHRDAVAYIATQLLAAIIAVLLLKLLIPSGAARTLAYGTPSLNPGMTLSMAIVIEAILTFMLMSAVYGTAVSPDAPKVGGFGIGLVLFFAILVGGPLTGAALNPARAFGPAAVANQWVAHIVWWIGPLVGAILAALVWEKVLLAKK